MRDSAAGARASLHQSDSETVQHVQVSLERRSPASNHDVRTARLKMILYVKCKYRFGRE